MFRQFRLVDEGDGDRQQKTYFASEDPPASQENRVDDDETRKGTQSAGEPVPV